MQRSGEDQGGHELQLLALRASNPTLYTVPRYTSMMIGENIEFIYLTRWLVDVLFLRCYSFREDVYFGDLSLTDWLTCQNPGCSSSDLYEWSMSNGLLARPWMFSSDQCEFGYYTVWLLERQDQLNVTTYTHF